MLDGNSIPTNQSLEDSNTENGQSSDGDSIFSNELDDRSMEGRCGSYRIHGADKYEGASPASETNFCGEPPQEQTESNEIDYLSGLGWKNPAQLIPEVQDKRWSTAHWPKFVLNSTGDPKDTPVYPDRSEADLPTSGVRLREFDGTYRPVPGTDDHYERRQPFKVGSSAAETSYAMDMYTLYDPDNQYVRSGRGTSHLSDRSNLITAYEDTQTSEEALLQYLDLSSYPGREQGYSDPGSEPDDRLMQMFVVDS